MNSRLQSPLGRLFGSVIGRYCAVAFALGLLLCGVLVQLGLDLRTLAGDLDPASSTIAGALEGLERSTIPLRGADGRIASTRAAIGNFYAGRIPTNYSDVSARIIQIGSAAGVQLSHAHYDQKPSGSHLTEVSIESEVSGTYPQIMRFVNGLERDPIFFVIRGMALTGQQGGDVNLQLRFSTWLRPAEGLVTEKDEDTVKGE